VLIERERHVAIREGRVTVLFRRWRRRLASAGSVHRTALGRVAVDTVDVVDPAGVTDEDARRAGYASAADVLADLRGDPDDPVYRLGIRYVAGPDPRDELAAAAELSAAEVDEIDARLRRMDLGRTSGPWTRAVLRVIARRPAVRAGDLAEELGRDTPQFKIDVRKLKNLGLTVSLGTGYELSPRGRAYLAATDAAE